MWSRSSRRDSPSSYPTVDLSDPRSFPILDTPPSHEENLKMSTRMSRRSMLKWMAAGSATASSGRLRRAGRNRLRWRRRYGRHGKTFTIGWARHGSEGRRTNRNRAGRNCFKANNPGVTVEPLVLPWGDYNTKIPVMVAGGTAPDTFGCHPALMAETHTAGGSTPLTDFIDAYGADLNYDDVRLSRRPPSLTASSSDCPRSPVPTSSATTRPCSGKPACLSPANSTGKRASTAGTGTPSSKWA